MLLEMPSSSEIFSQIWGFLSDMSCAKGNVALADYGITIKDQSMLPSEVLESEYRPKLGHSNLTFSVPYYHSSEINQPASNATLQEPYMARPALYLRGDGELWTAEMDLLRSDRFSPHFAVEIEDDMSAYLRFGDGIHGRRPTPGSILNASYRVGNGTSGNVGAESIAHLVMAHGGSSGIGRVSKVRNPLPAQGGTDPEPTYQAKLQAPYFFRRQHRAVTEDDYAKVAERHPDVDRAVAFLRWTGSWHTMYIIVDRKGRRPLTDDFKRNLKIFLERFRQTGCDIEIRPPRFVPLAIAFTVSVKPGYRAGHVKQELLKVFSSGDLTDGRRGFFHPANFSFGKPIYLCDIISAAMEVPGVAFVDASIREPHRFCPLAGASLQVTDEMISKGVIAPDRLEILQLDNDPNVPENGTIDFIMQEVS
jgi:predicted phage baseplate assembly protein